MGAEVENTSGNPSLFAQVVRRAWDWIFDRADTALSIAIAFMALVAVVVSGFSLDKTIPAIIIFLLTVAQYLLKHKSKSAFQNVRWRWLKQMSEQPKVRNA